MASVRISAAVLIPVWASVGIPVEVFERLPVVINETTSFCGSAGLERTVAFKEAVSLSGPARFTNTW